MSDITIEKGSLRELAEYVFDLQNDIFYYRQFITNIVALLRDKDKPAILLQGSKSAEDLCGLVWQELMRFKEELHGERNARKEDAL